MMIGGERAGDGKSDFSSNNELDQREKENALIKK
jgi:hypothetical protein